jgi:hypothetical protein
MSAVTRGLADVQLGLTTGTALVPGIERQRIPGLGAGRFLHRLDPGHPSAVSLRLSTLRVNSLAGIAGRTANRTHGTSGGGPQREGDGHFVGHAAGPGDGVVALIVP